MEEQRKHQPPTPNQTIFFFCYFSWNSIEFFPSLSDSRCRRSFSVFCSFVIFYVCHTSEHTFLLVGCSVVTKWVCVNGEKTPTSYHHQAIVNGPLCHHLPPSSHPLSLTLTLSFSMSVKYVVNAGTTVLFLDFSFIYISRVVYVCVHTSIKMWFFFSLHVEIVQCKLSRIECVRVLSYWRAIMHTHQSRSIHSE